MDWVITMEFSKVQLKEDFELNTIISLHYFEFASDYIFEGEKHNFWEFLYVDKGEAEVMADDMGYKLKQGDIIFHKPEEFHSVWANKKIAPNIIVLTFDCTSPSMKFFENKIFSLGDFERNILSFLIKEGVNSFLPPLNDPYKNTLLPNPGSEFGSQQLIKTYLQQLLIYIRRRHMSDESRERLSNPVKERSEDDITKKIDKFLHDHVATNVTLNELCSFMNMGRTHLVTLFKKRKGMGVIEYFKSIKVEHAKTLIREGNFNFSEISDILGYSSVHNFSRHFKMSTGVSPSHYAKSIKARIDL